MDYYKIITALTIFIIFMIFVFYIIGRKNKTNRNKNKNKRDNNQYSEYRVKCIISLTKITQREFNRRYIQEDFKKTIVSISGEEIEQDNISELIVESRTSVITVTFYINVSSKIIARAWCPDWNSNMRSIVGFEYGTCKTGFMTSLRFLGA